MANRFWVGDGGNWSDNTNHWSASDGGAGGAALPGAGDDVFFTANSFTIGAQTVEADAGDVRRGKNMDWTGATNSPTFTVNARTDVSGNITFIAAMTVNGSNGIRILATCSLISNGTAINCANIQPYSTVTLADDCTVNNVLHVQGAFDTNGKTLTCTTLDEQYSAARTLTLGASVINCTAWDYSGSNLTLNANTSTIKVTGTGVFTGGGLTYYNVELNGTAHTISGDNTYTKLSLKPSGAQTTTFTDTSTQTVGGMDRTGDGVITLTGTGAGGWTVIKTGPGPVSLENTVIDECTATPDNVWFFPRSTDGGNNFNIRYVIPYAGSGWWAMRR